MYIEKIYERACIILQKNLSQKQFIGFFNDSVFEILSLYPSDIVIGKNEHYIPVTSLKDSCNVKSDFMYAILNNILYCFTKDTSFKGDFLSCARNAYHQLWKNNCTGARMGAKGGTVNV